VLEVRDATTMSQHNVIVQTSYLGNAFPTISQHHNSVTDIYKANGKIHAILSRIVWLKDLIFITFSNAMEYAEIFNKLLEKLHGLFAFIYFIMKTVQQYTHEK